MKTLQFLFIGILFLLSSNSYSADLFKPLLGIYNCKENVPEGICDQRLEQVFTIEDAGEIEVTALKLSYIGDCGDQGPYFYFCEKKECSDYNSIKINLVSESQYEWQNFLYGFSCLMQKRTPSQNE